MFTLNQITLHGEVVLHVLKTLSLYFKTNIEKLNMSMLMPIIPQRVAPRYTLPLGCLDFKAKYHVNP